MEEGEQLTIMDQTKDLTSNAHDQTIVTLDTSRNSQMEICQADSTWNEHGDPESTEASNLSKCIKDIVKNTNDNVNGSIHSDRNTCHDQPLSSAVELDFTPNSKFSESSIIETSTPSEKEQKSLKRELIALINSAKESKIISESTQITSKIRKSRRDLQDTLTPNTPENINANRRDSSHSNSSDSNKRSMRSQNPEFVVKQKKFLSSVAGKEYKEHYKSSGSESDSDVSDVVINSMHRTNHNRSTKSASLRKMSSTDNHAPRVEVLADGKRSDPFCWRCHRDLQTYHSDVPRCSVCPRSFHTRCVGGVTMPSDLGSNWACPECVAVLHDENVDTRSFAMRSVTLTRLCELLKFALKRMLDVNGVEPFLRPVDTHVHPNYERFIVYPMDLSTLRVNIRAGKYGSTTAFIADTKWILHNSIIFNSQQSRLTTVAKTVLKVCKAEMAEIETCPSCYEGANAYRLSWFTDVCEKPHILLWAKLKGFPYWPAKGMRVSDTGVLDVRFFGAHDRAWLNPRDCFLYSAQDPNGVTRSRKNDIIEAVKEVDIHIKNIIRKFGGFTHAPFKCLYVPAKEHEQLKLMIPNYNAVSISTREKVLQVYAGYRNTNKAIKQADVNTEENAKNQALMEGYGTEDDEPVESTARTKYASDLSRDDSHISLKSRNEEFVLSISSSESSPEKSPSEESSRKRSNSSENSTAAKKVLIIENNSGDVSNNVAWKNDSSKDKVKESTSNIIDKLRKLEEVVNNNNNSLTDKSNPLLKKLWDKNRMLNRSLSGSSIEEYKNGDKDVEATPPSAKTMVFNINRSKAAFSTGINSQSNDIDIPNASVFKPTRTKEQLPSNFQEAVARLRQLKNDTLPPFNNCQTLKVITEKYRNSIEDINCPQVKDTKIVECLPVLNNHYEVTENSKEETGQVNDSKQESKTVNSATESANDSIITVDLIMSDSNKTDMKDGAENSNETNSKLNDLEIEVPAASDTAEVDRFTIVTSTNSQTVKSAVGTIKVSDFARTGISPPPLTSIEPLKSSNSTERRSTETEKNSDVLSEQLSQEKNILLESLQLQPSGLPLAKPIESRPGHTIRINRSLTKKIRTSDPGRPEQENLGKILETVTINNVQLSDKQKSIGNTIIGKQIHKAKKTFPQSVKQQALIKQYIGSSNEAKAKVINIRNNVLNNGNTFIYMPPLLDSDKRLQILAPLSAAKDSANAVSKAANRVTESILLPKITTVAAEPSTSSLVQFQVTSLPSVSTGAQPLLQVSPANVIANAIGQNKRAPVRLTAQTSTVASNAANTSQIQAQPNKTSNMIDIDVLCNSVSKTSQVHKLLQLSANKMSQTFRKVLLESLLDMSTAGCPEAIIRVLQLELEDVKQRHQSEMEEMKHNFDIMVSEMRASFDSELQMMSNKLRHECELEKIQAVSEAKTKQWCAYCGSLSQFHCCWNTSYCNYPCQMAHWSHHINYCGQQNNSDSSSTQPVPLMQKTKVVVVSNSGQKISPSLVSSKGTAPGGASIHSTAGGTLAVTCATKIINQNNGTITSLAPINGPPPSGSRVTKFVINKSSAAAASVPTLTSSPSASSESHTSPASPAGYIIMSNGAGSYAKQAFIGPAGSQ